MYRMADLVVKRILGNPVSGLEQEVLLGSVSKLVSRGILKDINLTREELLSYISDNCMEIAFHIVKLHTLLVDDPLHSELQDLGVKDIALELDQKFSDIVEIALSAERSGRLLRQITTDLKDNKSNMITADADKKVLLDGIVDKIIDNSIEDSSVKDILDKLRDSPIGDVMVSNTDDSYEVKVIIHKTGIKL